MEYNNEFGIAYDCLLFGILYFNNEFLYTESIPGEHGIMIDPLSIYKEALDYGVTPNETLKIFFERSINYSLLDNFFDNNMFIETDDINTFKKYTGDERRFLIHVIKHFVGIEDSKTLDSIYKAPAKSLEKYRLAKETKNKVLHIINNYEDLRNQLFSYFDKIYPVVSALHEKYSEDISEYMEYMKEIISDGSIKEIYNIDFDVYDKIIVKVLLFNKYYLLFNPSKNLSTLTGLETIRYEYFKKKYKVINCQNFFKLSCDDFGHEIYTLLKNADEALCVSEIAENLSYPSYWVTNILNRFVHEQIIAIEKITQEKAYYRFNLEFIQYVKPQLADYLDELTGSTLTF